MGDKISAGGDSVSKQQESSSATAHRHYFNEDATRRKAESTEEF